jgi:hypothetical protein
MRTASKIIVGATLAGLAAAGGAAFTGAGLTQHVNAATQFIGGTVQETITGADVTGVVYNYSPTDSIVTSVDLTFAATVENRIVTIQLGHNYTCTVDTMTPTSATCDTTANPETAPSNMSITVV